MNHFIADPGKGKQIGNTTRSNDTIADVDKQQSSGMSTGKIPYIIYYMTTISLTKPIRY